MATIDFRHRLLIRRSTEGVTLKEGYGELRFHTLTGHGHSVTERHLETTDFKIYHLKIEQLSSLQEFGFQAVEVFTQGTISKKIIIKKFGF